MATQFYVVGYLRTGGGFYVSRHRTAPNRTPHKNHAWRLTLDEAEEMINRLHQVQALGHHHQDVIHYDRITAA